MQRARGKDETGKSGTRLIVVLSLFWALLFVGIALLLLISRLPELTLQPQDSFVVSDPFPLRGISPDSFSMVGSTLIRLEEGGVVVLDTSGGERSFIDFPYRQSKVISMRGGGLLVTPAEGSGFMAVFPDLSTLESDTREIIYGGDCRDPYLLVFGSSLKGKMVASLLDTRTGSCRVVLTFSSLEWPMGVSFVPGTDQFDLVMLDLSKGEMVTSYLRYDYDGNQVSDTILSEGDLYPMRVHLEGGQTFFYNEREVIVLDRLQRMAHAGPLPGDPVQADSGGGRLVLLTEENKVGGLQVVKSPDQQSGSVFQVLEVPGEITSFAVAPSGSFMLVACRGELIMYDMETLGVVIRQPVDAEITRMLALSDQHFLVLLQEEAVIVTIR